jgi:hypothetical protein
VGKRDEFAILDHIRSHLPPLKPVEREALERLLVEQGCRDPNYAYQSIADPNGLIKLQSSYKALGLSPTLA